MVDGTQFEQPSAGVDAEGRVRLNLGAADRHLPGFVCIDIAPPLCVECGDEEGRSVNLEDDWPWPDSSVEEALALDVAEHIGDQLQPSEDFVDEFVRRSGRVHFMNQLHRVLIPGGRATIETPNAARGVGFWQDPTHVSPFCLSTFKYFEHGAFAHQRLSKAYGITAAFRVISLTESQSNGENPAEQVWKIKAVLECVK